MQADEPAAAVAETTRRQDDAETYGMQQLRAMEQPSWTEGRLDDLNKKVDGGIGRLDEERKELRTEVKEGFRDLRTEMNGRFEKVDKGFEKVDGEFKAVRKGMKEGFDKVDERFDKVDRRFDAMQRTLIASAATIIAAVIGAAAALIVALIAMPPG